MLPLRIFLSSPGDLDPERAIAEAVIDELSRSPLVRERAILRPARWDDEAARVPMDAGQTPQESVNEYLGVPADCDLTIVLLWSRIGSPPAGLTRPDGSPYPSGTVWEYENALGANRPIFVYRKDVKPQVDLDDPELATKQGQYTAVRRFFDGFREADGALRAGCNTFANAEDFRRQFRQHLEHFLRRRLEGAGSPPASPLADPTFRWPPAGDFAAIIAEKRDGFSGRDWLFAEVDAWVADPASRALLIRADYGVGKSAFLAELVARNPGGRVAAWHFCQHDTRETLRPGAFVRNLAGRLRDSLPGYREAVEARPELQDRLDGALEDPGSAFEAALLNPLATLPAPPAPRLILIDALDEALEVDREEAQRVGSLVALLANKASRLPPWLRLVVTARNNPEVISRLQGAFTLTQIDAEGADNRDDLYAYAHRQACQDPIAAQLGAAGKSADWLAGLLRDRAGGKFLYVARALRDLKEKRLTLAQAGELPPGMDGFYRDAFERRFEKAGRAYEPYRALLGLLCALREPVSAGPLAELLGCEARHIQAARALLPDFIVKRQGGYTFEHFSIAEWLSRENDEGFPRAGSYAVDLTAAEACIHDRALQRIQDGNAHQFDYLVRHLAHHLPDAGERREAFTTLMQDYRWLRERLRLDGVDALLADCQHLGEGEFARLLAACLCNSAHILRRNPEQLAVQTLGRLGERTAVPEITHLRTSVRKAVRQAVSSGELASTLLPRTVSLRLNTALSAVLQGHDGKVTALAVLPDGRLVSGSYDETIRLWDLQGGAEPHVLESLGGGVRALTVLPGGRLVAAAGARVLVWQAGFQRIDACFEADAVVKSLAAPPSGGIVAGDASGRLHFLELIERQP